MTNNVFLSNILHITLFVGTFVLYLRIHMPLAELRIISAEVSLLLKSQIQNIVLTLTLTLNNPNHNTNFELYYL